MKNFLLTWYGITDLHAAIGFEDFGGPILGALRDGGYSDVLILAYTDPTKDTDELSEKRRALLETLPRDRSEIRSMARVEEMDDLLPRITDAFANSSDGHRLYQDWLTNELESMGLATNVRMCTRELEFLNDAKGIYAAVAAALDVVYANDAEKRVTFYLSPGTPVMAFTWAFVSMVNPELNISIIASSDFRKAPEEIRLPFELMAPSARKPRPAKHPVRDSFDTIFHLFGEQRLPSVFSISQFKCKRHVFVTSGKYRSESMQEFLPAGSELAELLVNPFDPMSAKVEILKAVGQLPDDSCIGFNLTGGTKLMFAGAIAACEKIGGIPFYLESQNHNLIFLDDFSIMELRGFDDLDTFFQAAGFTVSDRGVWSDRDIRLQRIELTKKLWTKRGIISEIYRSLSDYNDGTIPFNVKNKSGDVVASLDENCRAKLQLKGEVFSFQNSPDFAKYLCGGWLEEYTFLLLEPLLQEGLIRDLRIGLEVSWALKQGQIKWLDKKNGFGLISGDSGDIFFHNSSVKGTDFKALTKGQSVELQDEVSPKGRPEATFVRVAGDATSVPKSTVQEFDIVFTEGKRLFIVECKAGKLLNEDFYKLQNNVGNYGGIHAKGLLVACFEPPFFHRRTLTQRFKNAANLSFLSGETVQDELKSTVSSMVQEQQ